MSDMEQRLRDAFSAKAERITETALTPATNPTDSTSAVGRAVVRRRLNRVWLPALTAAAVAGVIVASLGFVSNAQSQHRAPIAPATDPVVISPFTPTETPSASLSSSTPTTSSQPKQSPSSTDTSESSATQESPTTTTTPTATTPTTAWDDPSQFTTWTFVDPGVPMPDGWTLGSGEVANVAGYEEWCVQAPQPTGYAGCPIRLYEVQKKNTVDVTWLEGFPGVGSQTMDGMYCTHTGANATAQLTQETRDFGGRSADYRQWTIHCDDGRVFTPTHYVVPDYPGFVLVTNGQLASEVSALDWMAAHAVLPTG